MGCVIWLRQDYQDGQTQRPSWDSMSKEVRWLWGQLEQWVGKGLMSPEQAGQIRKLYPEPKAALPWGTIIFSGLGALMLAWAMPSLAQALLATTVLCIWGCTEGWGFERAMPWAPLLILVSLGGLSWRMRSPLLLFFVLTAFVLSLMANVQAVAGG